MKLELTIDGNLKEYSIPESWDDVTLGMFEGIVRSKDEEGTELMKAMKLVCAVTGIELKYVMGMPIEDLGKILDVLKFSDTPVPQEKKESIEIEGEEYFFRDVFDKMTSGEVYSIDLIAQNHGQKAEYALSEFMCIFLRKKIDGKLEDFQAEFMERADLFRNNVKVVDVYQLVIFFSDGETTLSKIIKDSLAVTKGVAKTEDSH